MAEDRIIFRVHAIERMFERGISAEDVRQVLATGDVIGEYRDDTPHPSRLILGFRDDRPIRIVAADNADTSETAIITVYEPDPAKWDSTFSRKLT